ncbi:MAG: DUF2218 domain-containing protein [Xanthobacteraceae bacterium]|nr:MAG: DUF2218 domain-containing protein [Xanthobacteraceae bacterium]
MLQARAVFPTSSGSRYLQQLCKHWSHKFTVEFTPETGRIALGNDRVCRLEATPEHLVMVAEAPDAEALEHLEGVIVRHVQRFAFRENLDAVSWSAPQRN